MNNINNEHVYSPYRQKHTKYTKDSTQIHKNQVHKKYKAEKQSIILLLTLIYGSLIHLFV